MGHWRRLIKIPGGTDCYYCINHMTCLTHVYYCPFIFLLFLSDMLSTIMSPVYLITLSYICYTPCGNVLFMHTYTLHCIYSAFMYTLQTSVQYMHNTVVWLCCILHTCMFISITSPLYNTIYYITGY